MNENGAAKEVDFRFSEFFWILINLWGGFFNKCS